MPIDSRGQDDEARGQPGSVDRQRGQPLADLERHGLDVLLEDRPAAAPAGLEPAASEDERALVLVGEVGLAVDPAVDPDVARRPRGRQALGVLDRRDRRRGQQPPDPVGRSERSQDEGPGHQGGGTRGDDEEGLHEPG